MGTKYLTHTACDIGAVPKKAIPKGTTVEEMVRPYLVQLKYDGVCGIMIVDGDNIHFLTRTGELVTSCNHIRDAFRLLPFDFAVSTLNAEAYRDEESRVEVPQQYRDGVYFGELWSNELAQTTVAGLVNKHESVELTSKVQFVVFDFVTLEEYRLGESDVGFEDRIDRIAWMQQIYHPEEGGEFANGVKPSVPPIWFAGHEGMLNEQAALTVMDLAKEAKAKGRYDGIILRDGAGPWRAGARDQYIIKVKPNISLDLRVVGVVEGKGKYAGVLGALIVQYKNTTFQLSGMSDAERQLWWKNPGLIVGRVVEVVAMGESDKGKLREPRFKGIRTDSLPEEEK